jgi:hypothetical protein
METIGYLAIQEFKKLQSEEQKDLALKFVARAWRPKKKYRFDLVDLFKLHVTDSDVEGLVRFLKGEVTFRLQSIIPLKLSGQWQDALEQFNAYLFKEKPEFKVLKKGYDRPLRIPTLEQYTDIITEIGKDKLLMTNVLVDMLPAMERSIIAIPNSPNSVTSKGGTKRRGPNYLKKRALKRFGRLSGTIRHRIKLLNKIKQSLIFLKFLLGQDTTINKVKKGEYDTLASRGASGAHPKGGEQSYEKLFPAKPHNVSLKKLQKIRKQIFAWQRTFELSSIEYAQMVKSCEEQCIWFKQNLKNLIDFGPDQEGTKNVFGLDVSSRELQNAQRAFNKIKDEANIAIPFVGAGNLYDPVDPGSDESKTGIAMFAIDSALLWAAIASASTTAGVSVIMAFGYFIIYETALAVGLGAIIPYIINQLEYVAPNLFAKETPY